MACSPALHPFIQIATRHLEAVERGGVLNASSRHFLGEPLNYHDYHDEARARARVQVER